MQGRGGSWRHFQLHPATTGPTQDGSPVHGRTGTSDANELARNVADFLKLSQGSVVLRS